MPEFQFVKPKGVWHIIGPEGHDNTTVNVSGRGGLEKQVKLGKATGAVVYEIVSDED